MLPIRISEIGGLTVCEGCFDGFKDHQLGIDMNEMTVDSSKRRFLVAMSSTLGGVAAVGAALPFVFSMNPSARALAAGAPVEVDLSKIEPGMKVDVEWRGKPVWVVHRTPEMLEMLGKHEDKLVDPRSENTSQQPDYCKNPTRSIKPEYFIVVGICTHLGCSPTYRKEIGPADLGPDWPGVVLPLSRFPFRHGGARVRRLARTRQPGGAATQISQREQGAHRRGPGHQRLIS